MARMIGLQWANRRRLLGRGDALAAEARLGYLFVLPAALVIVAVAFVPLLHAFWLSLHDIDLRYPAQGEPFVGLGNYLFLAGYDRLHNALVITTAFAAISVTLELVLGMIIALIMNREFWGRGMVRAALLVPWALTTVVSARMWEWIYNAQYGIFNAALRWLGLIEAYRAWTVDQQFAFWAAILADVWKTTPFMALLLLAGLQVMPHELYEAAMVDGANAWQRFWRITLPLLKPTILVALLFRTLDAARIFDLLFVLTGGGPGYATESLSILAYRTLFVNLNFGMGSALAVVVVLYVMIISFIYIKVLGTQAGRAI
jgi:multiple sugar transport system permease protein